MDFGDATGSFFAGSNRSTRRKRDQDEADVDAQRRRKWHRSARDENYGEDVSVTAADGDDKWELVSPSKALETHGPESECAKATRHGVLCASEPKVLDRCGEYCLEHCPLWAQSLLEQVERLTHVRAYAAVRSHGGDRVQDAMFRVARIKVTCLVPLQGESRQRETAFDWDVDSRTWRVNGQRVAAERGNKRLALELCKCLGEAGALRWDLMVRPALVLSAQDQLDLLGIKWNSLARDHQGNEFFVPLPYADHLSGWAIIPSEGSAYSSSSVLTTTQVLRLQAPSSPLQLTYTPTP